MYECNLDDTLALIEYQRGTGEDERWIGVESMSVLRDAYCVRAACAA